MKFWFFVGAVILAAASGYAANPEGDGWLNFTAGMTPANVALNMTDSSGNQRSYNSDPGYVADLRGAFSPHKGFGLYGQAVGDFWTDNIDFGDVSSSSDSSTFDDRRYQYAEDLGTAKVTYFPGEWFAGPYIPGVDANADGWLLWPNVSVGYSDSETTLNESIYNSTLTLISSGFFYEYIHEVGTGGRFSQANSQRILYEVTLPLCAALSLESQYTQNLVESVSGSRGGQVLHDADETVELGLNAYLNLVNGAGADRSRPFLPGLGRLGQLALTASWERTAFPGQYLVDQAALLNLAAPVSSHLGLHLALEWEEPNGPPVGTSGSQVLNRNDAILTYWAGLSWAFGAPSHREDGP